MYAESLVPGALGRGFTSLATWTQDAKEWAGLLPADPGFEIAWAVRDGEIEGRARLTPPNRHPVWVNSKGGDVRLRLLRLRPEFVGLLVGPEAADLVDQGRLDLADLGPQWRAAAMATTDERLFRALSALSHGVPDPMVHASINRLRSPRPPAYRDIAREMGYSYEQWRRRMMAATGVTPKFYARYARLRNASRLARSHPHMTMGEVAVRTGFASDCALAAEAADLSGRTFRELTAGFTLPE